MAPPEPPAPPDPTQSAVVVTVPAAEPAVARHRLELDRSAAWGVPAHVTVLYPFVPPARLDPGVLARLADAVASVPRFDCTFARCAWFGADVLWLAPEPDRGFRDLTSAVASAFPEHPPYEGAFPDVVPHLTVGELRFGSPARLRRAEEEVCRRLPLSVEVAAAHLLVGSDRPGSWSVRAALPLGPRTSAAAGPEVASR